MIFLDKPIKKAFDSVCHQKIIKKLNFYGIRGVANNLFSSCLSNRSQCVTINVSPNYSKIFADNTALHISQSTFLKLEDMANNELNNISQWMLCNGLNSSS